MGSVKAAEIDDRKFIRIVLIRMNLRSLTVVDLSELSRSQKCHFLLEKRIIYYEQAKIFQGKVVEFLIKGLILGFSIAAPVGPIGIHCIRKTLQFGRLSGLCSGLGAAVADLIYGIIAVFGLTFISNLLLAGQLGFRLIGGLFLVYLGIKTFIYKTKIEAGKKANQTSLVKDFITTFFLTATNPMTILSFIAIFAGLGLSQDGNNSIPLVLGVFLGSALWWLMLCEFVTLFRKRIEEKMMQWINRIAGLIIFGFGIAALVTAFCKFEANRWL